MSDTVETTESQTQTTDHTVRIDCDHDCPARAYVTVRAVTGSELDLCGHHYHENEALYALYHFEVTRDERGQI